MSVARWVARNERAGWDLTRLGVTAALLGVNLVLVLAPAVIGTLALLGILG